MSTLLPLLSALINFPTTADRPDQITACFNYLKKELAALPFTVEEYEHNGVQSVLWRGPNSTQHAHDTRNPRDDVTPLRLLLNAHLDVVPAAPELFTLRQDKDMLYGRGVADMKFSIAAMVSALQTYFAQHHSLPPVDLLITSDEEVGGCNGVGYLVEKLPLDYDCVFIPDGGDHWHVIEETKGALQLRITTTGKSAHGSRPWEGDSALDTLLTILNSLRQQFPVSPKYTWNSTLNIGQVHGGQQVNQVADQAFAGLDFRYPASVDGTQLLADVRAVISQHCPNERCQIEIVTNGAPLKVDRHHPVIAKWCRLIQDKHAKPGDLFVKETGSTDGRYFAAKGLNVLLSQPECGGLHTDHEWLNKSSFVEYTEVLGRFFQSLN